MKYVSKKPDKMKGPDNNFYLGCKNLSKASYEKESVWYIEQNMGVGTIAKLLMDQMVKHGIEPKDYNLTGTSVRFVK